MVTNNGWIYNGDPLVDFAAKGSDAYLAREVVIWGDCVKLRYGESRVRPRAPTPPAGPGGGGHGTIKWGRGLVSGADAAGIARTEAAGRGAGRQSVAVGPHGRVHAPHGGHVSRVPDR